MQQLIEQLAQRDEAVANKGREANRAFAELKTAKENIARLEAVARATGERAAAAEASLAARADSAALLHTEVCKLRERYLSELSELKMLKAAAAEADRYKAQLDAAQGVSAALVEARDELRSAVSMLTSRLAGAEERARRFAASTSIRDSVLEVGLPAKYNFDTKTHSLLLIEKPWKNAVMTPVQHTLCLCATRSTLLCRAPLTMPAGTGRYCFG